MHPAEHEKLRTVAELLGCPVSAFGDDAQLPQDLRDLSELFRLWLRMGTSGDRAHLLMLARHLLHMRAKRDADRRDADQRDSGRHDRAAEP